MPTYTKDYTAAAIYTQNYDKNYEKIWVGAKQYEKSYQKIYAGAAFNKEYEAAYVKADDRIYSGLTGNFLGSVTYLKEWVKTYTRDAGTVNFTKDWTKTYSHASETANYTAVYTKTYEGGNYTGYATYTKHYIAHEYTKVWTKVYAKVWNSSAANYSKDYTTTYRATGTGTVGYANYLKDYTGGTSPVYSANYTTGSMYFGVSIVNYIGSFPGQQNYNKDYIKAYAQALTYVKGYAPSTNYTLISYTKDYNKIYVGAIYTKIWSKDYNKDYSKDYTATYTKIWTKAYTGVYTGEYSKDYLKTYTKVWTGSYVGDFTRAWTKDYDKVYQQNFNKEYTAAFSKDYTAVYTKIWSKAYTGILYYGGYGGYGGYNSGTTANYSTGYTKVYTKIWTKNYNRVFSKTYVGDFSKVWTKDYEAVYQQTFTGEYSADYTKTYTKVYVGVYTGDYSKDYSADYAKIWSTIYTKTYSKDYTAQYQGDYSKVYTKAYEGLKPQAFEVQFAGIKTSHHAYEGNTNYLGARSGVLANTAPRLFVHKHDRWQQIKALFVNDGGLQKEVKYQYVKSGNEHQLVHIGYKQTDIWLTNGSDGPNANTESVFYTRGEANSTMGTSATSGTLTVTGAGQNTSTNDTKTAYYVSQFNLKNFLDTKGRDTNNLLTMTTIHIGSNEIDDAYFVLGSNSISVPALDLTGFQAITMNTSQGNAATSTAFSHLVRVVTHDNGYVVGKGGNGGSAGTNASGGHGQDGGDAIELGNNVTLFIENYGTIGGGGGGGGAGGVTMYNDPATGAVASSFTNY